jgi:hypothetical protein
MIIHYLKNKTDLFPKMKKNSNDSKNNTNKNRDDFFKQLKKISQYMMIFDHEIGKLDIWYFGPYSQEYKVSMYNTFGSRTVEIRYFYSGLEVSLECHQFNPFGFSALVNKYFLTQNELDKQKAFEQQEQERKDALKKAHDSSPRTCAGDHRCEHCIDEQRERERLTHRDLGRYT